MLRPVENMLGLTNFGIKSQLQSHLARLAQVVTAESGNFLDLKSWAT